MTDQKEEFASAFATASAKALATGRLSEFNLLLAMVPARIPETDRILNCEGLL